MDRLDCVKANSCCVCALPLSRRAPSVSQKTALTGGKGDVAALFVCFLTGMP